MKDRRQIVTKGRPHQKKTRALVFGRKIEGRSAWPRDLMFVCQLTSLIGQFYPTSYTPRRGLFPKDVVVTPEVFFQRHRVCVCRFLERVAAGKFKENENRTRVHNLRLKPRGENTVQKNPPVIIKKRSSSRSRLLEGCQACIFGSNPTQLLFLVQQP